MYGYMEYNIDFFANKSIVSLRAASGTFPEEVCRIFSKLNSHFRISTTILAYPSDLDHSQFCAIFPILTS